MRNITFIEKHNRLPNNLEFKPDCFGYERSKSGCGILRTDNCSFCKFYKTREQIYREREF